MRDLPTGPVHALSFDPMDRAFRRMIAFSIGFHLVLFGVMLTVSALRLGSQRHLSVAVVDLVGGPAVAPPPPAPAREKAREPEPPAREKEDRRKEAGRKAPPPKAAREAKPAPPERSVLAERIRKMREEAATRKEVRRTVEEMRREREVRTAVRGIQDRVARRIDLSGVRTPAAGVPAAVTGASAGERRVPPEQLAYFRLLDERIRANWTVPFLPPEETKSLMVQLRITIEKDGRVSSVWMEKGSGNTFFDDSVLRAIRKASPLPVPPEQLRGAEEVYEVGFRFFGSPEPA